MKNIILGLAFVLSLFTVACTEQQRAKNFGGEVVIQLAEGKKLENVTWKDEQLWILTRDKRTGEASERYEFKENSVFGVFEGSVIIVER